MTDVEVLRQLDFTAGRLSRRSRMRLAVLLVISTLAGLGIVMLLKSGVVTPQIGRPRNGYGTSAEYHSGYAARGFPVENHGLVAITIVGFGAAPTGLVTLPARPGQFPLLLEPGKQAELFVEFQVTDCAVLQREILIPLRIQRRWGEQTGHIKLEQLGDKAMQLCQAAPD